MSSHYRPPGMQRRQLGDQFACAVVTEMSEANHNLGDTEWARWKASMIRREHVEKVGFLLYMAISFG
jgi:hypothetical protein